MTENTSTHRMLRGKVYAQIAGSLTRLNKDDQIILTNDQAKKFEAKGWAEAITLEVTEKPNAKRKAEAKAKVKAKDSSK